MPLIDELTAFYSKETFFEESCPEGLLQNCCKYAADCWEGIDDEEKKAADWNYFSLPYIGEDYKGELVCVGLNIHKGGGRNVQEAMVKGYDKIDHKKLHTNDKYADKYEPGVIQSLSEGKKTVKYETGMKKHDIDFPGTPLFHRIAVYSKIILDGYQPNIENGSKELADIYRRIIFMDAIKCSPANDQSKPTSAMRKICPGYIFFKELEITKPNNILIFSKAAAVLMQEHYAPEAKEFPHNKNNYDHCKMEIGGKKTNVFYVIHPTAQGGASLSLIPGFGDFIKQKT